MKKVLTLAIGVMLVAGILRAADITEAHIYEAHDSSPALRVHNNGTEKATFYIYEDSGATNKIVIGTTETLLDMSATAIDTVSELASAVRAATNSAGETPLDTDVKCVAATSETVDDELLVNTSGVSIEGGDWGDAFIWDTSDVKHYRIYVPPSGKGQTRKSALAKSVKMNAGGTGNITVKGYINSTEVFSRIVVSPTYVLAATATGNTAQATAADEVGPANLDVDLGIYIGISQGFLLSIDRATTGTTGGNMLELEYE